MKQKTLGITPGKQWKRYKKHGENWRCPNCKQADLIPVPHNKTTEIIGYCPKCNAAYQLVDK